MNYNTDSTFTNPYADGTYDVPDAMSYDVIALMDDGGTLCHKCVTDPTNPVYSVHDVDTADYGDGRDGWCIVGWFHSGECEDLTVCDHCGTVIVEDWQDEA